MLGLRFFVCRSCDAVSAVPAVEETARACSRCQAAELREITGRVQDDAYFLADR